MQDIRNSLGKLVCRADAANLIVEIIHKGIKTTIQFMPGGQPLVINTTS
jgi:hypothetical protein